MNNNQVTMQDIDVNLIIRKIKETIGNPVKPVGLHEPSFGGNEVSYVKECIETGWVSYVGKFVTEFENRLCEFTGVKYASAMVNGTAALHMALIVSEISAGDEVLVPTLTFVATVNTIMYCNAYPHFIDSNQDTLVWDPKKLRDYLKEIVIRKDAISYNKQTQRPIKAIIVMHAFGHPVQIEEICEICKEFNLILIEDAAESLGSYYNEKHTGNWEKFLILSFNGNKILTTGGGGALLSNDENIAKKAKHLSTTAKKQPWLFIHDSIGYNYRMPNVNAAIGCAQIENLEKLLIKKRKLALEYIDNFRSVQGVSIFTEPEKSKSNYWLNVLLLDKNCIEYRDKILELSNIDGIMTRPAWNLMHSLKMFKNFPKMNLSVAESLQKRIINLPSSPNLLN